MIQRFQHVTLCLAREPACRLVLNLKLLAASLIPQPNQTQSLECDYRPCGNLSGSFIADCRPCGCRPRKLLELSLSAANESVSSQNFDSTDKHQLDASAVNDPQRDRSEPASHSVSRLLFPHRVSYRQGSAPTTEIPKGKPPEKNSGLRRSMSPGNGDETAASKTPILSILLTLRQFRPVAPNLAIVHCIPGHLFCPGLLF